MHKINIHFSFFIHLFNTAQNRRMEKFNVFKNETLPEINTLRHSFDSWCVIGWIDGNKLLSQLIEKLDVMLIGVQFGVERLNCGWRYGRKKKNLCYYFFRSFSFFYGKDDFKSRKTTSFINISWIMTWNEERWREIMWKWLEKMRRINE